MGLIYVFQKNEIPKRMIYFGNQLQKLQEQDQNGQWFVKLRGQIKLSASLLLICTLFI